MESKRGKSKKSRNIGVNNGMYGKSPWNKGTKGIMKPNSGSFKNGHISWLKGKHIKINNALEIYYKNGGKSWSLGKKRPDITGKNHPNWKGGKLRTKAGYIYIYNPNHPFASKRYVAEHRLIAEQFLNRYLFPKEKIHHINGIPDDNCQENLYLFKSQYSHNSFHNLKNKPILISNLLCVG